MNKAYKFFFSLLFVMSLTCGFAQPGGHHGKMPKFDPQRFQADLEQFITSEAALTPQEAAAFFPVYREMMEKQRTLFVQAGKNRYVKPVDDEGCRKAIEQSDDIDLRIKELQQQYHKRFMKILNPRKVYDVLKAENRFHRQALKRPTWR